MSEQTILENNSDSLKQLQRALFYETQFRNAILSDSVSFYDANITQDSIDNEFFFKDDNNDFISVPDFIGISTPCKFSEFIKVWCQSMVADLSQKALEGFKDIREKLLNLYTEGKREYVLNYWAESVNGKKVFFNQLSR